MQRKPMIFGLCGLLLGLGLTACGGSSQVDEAAALRDATWAELQTMNQELKQKRQQLAELNEQAEAAAAEAGQQAAEAGEAAGEDLAAKSEELRKEVDEAAQDFSERLVAFINENPPIQGEPLTERQKAAIRMKSDEDIVLASEYIDKGGDYRRAIKIFEDALTVDPDYERLKEELAAAEEMRFTTEERFAQIKKGMTESEVRAALGPVNLRNVRYFEKDDVTAWYYPTSERGDAAAVWFRKDKKKGGLVVYQTQFDAISREEEGEES